LSLQWKFIAVYYAIACGFSWVVWAPLVLGRQGLGWLPIAPPFPLIICAGTLGPLVACYLTHRLQTGNWRAIRFFPPRRLRLLWLILGPLLVLFCFFIVFPALLTKGGPRSWRWHPMVLVGIPVPMFNYNLFGGPLFEEFGWRGFLQPRLQTAIPPWISSICVGVMWATWHAPLFLVHGWSSSTPQAFLLIVVGLAMVMALGFNASGESVVVALLMHSAFNASPRFIEPYLGNVATRERPSPELLIAASFLLMGAVLAVLTRGRLSA
jgi:membrane protease YdiL (CAAX protease family)